MDQEADVSVVLFGTRKNSAGQEMYIIEKRLAKKLLLVTIAVLLLLFSTPELATTALELLK